MTTPNIGSFQGPMSQDLRNSKELPCVKGHFLAENSGDFTKNDQRIVSECFKGSPKLAQRGQRASKEDVFTKKRSKDCSVSFKGNCFKGSQKVCPKGPNDQRIVSTDFKGGAVCEKVRPVPRSDEKPHLPVQRNR